VPCRVRASGLNVRRTVRNAESAAVIMLSSCHADNRRLLLLVCAVRNTGGQYYQAASDACTGLSRQAGAAAIRLDSVCRCKRATSGPAHACRRWASPRPAGPWALRRPGRPRPPRALHLPTRIRAVRPPPRFAAGGWRCGWCEKSCKVACTSVADTPACEQGTPHHRLISN